MGRVEKTVFISYRRTNVPWAIAIYKDLTAHGYDVFFDYESIASGDFEQIILGNIRARAHFLVVLTPSALERCDNPNDWLRREIETALDEKRNIVPLFLEGFDFNSPSIAKHLTGKLANLKKYNGQSVPAGFFDDAMRRVRERYLNTVLDAVLHPVSKTVQKVVQEQQAAASRATAVKEKELAAQEWYERAHNSTNADEKIRCFTESIRLSPYHPEAYFDRGNARYDNGDFDGAMKDYNQAIRIEPDNANAYFSRGRACYLEGDYDGAIKDYTEAIRLKHGFIHAYYARGLARQQKGDLDGSIKDFTEAIRLKPDHVDAYFYRGASRHGKEDFDGAIKDYTEVIRLTPNNAEGYLNRGNVRTLNGDFDGALKDYNQVIRIEPDNVDVYLARGLVYQEKGDLDGAIKDYTNAIRLRPDADTYAIRGYVWDLKRNYYSAAADYQKYFQLGGTDEDIRQNLKKARKKIGK